MAERLHFYFSIFVSYFLMIKYDKREMCGLVKHAQHDTWHRAEHAGISGALFILDVCISHCAALSFGMKGGDEKRGGPLLTSLEAFVDAID